MQLERARVDPSGQGEAATLELVAHPVIEVQRENADGKQQCEQTDTEDPDDSFAARHRVDFTRPNLALPWQCYR